jgi:alanyl-tRNA synthetase
MNFQTEMTNGTTVTFAGGSEIEDATVLFTAALNSSSIVVVDRSPFHPVSLSWPDQPGDTGSLTTSGGAQVTIIDSSTGLLNTETGQLLIGNDAELAKRGELNVHAVVLHFVTDNIDLVQEVGQRVTLQVDKARRRTLSLQHTGVHLAALALNRCAAQYWTKDYSDRDSLGYPNFDKTAVAQSMISSDCSTDVYRIGKSLRKKGFDRDAFLTALPDIARSINGVLSELLLAAAPVSVSPSEGPLDGRRVWSTRLRGAEVSIPCGGTHISDLSQIADINVDLAQSGDGFSMVTRSGSRVQDF